MQKGWFFLIQTVIGLAFCPMLSGQDLNFSFHLLSREQGLRFANDYQITRDQYGFIWISTEEGLDRYDGRQVAHFAPETGDAQVTSRCMEDPDGNLWFSTFSALHCYRRSTGRVQTFPTGTPALLDMQAFYLDPEQHLWLRAGADAGEALYQFDISTGQYRRVCSIRGKRCSAICDGEGRVTQVISTMLADSPGMIITDLRSGQSNKVEFNRLPDGSARRSSPAKNVFLEGDSIVWVGLYNALGKYDLRSGASSIILTRTETIAADVGWIHDVVSFDDRFLLIASSEGLLVFDKSAHSFVQQFHHRADIPHSIADGEITRLYRDCSDQLWLSGLAGGIAFTHLYKTKFKAIETTAGIRISGMYIDKNSHVWCGTVDSGAYIFHTDGKMWMHTQDLDNQAQPDEHFSLPGITAFWENEPEHVWGFAENNALQWVDKKRQFEFREKNFFGVANAESDKIRLFPPLLNGTQLAAKGKDVWILKAVKDKVVFLPWLSLYSIDLQQITSIFQSRNGLFFMGDNRFRIIALIRANDALHKTAEWTDTGDCSDFVETGDSLVWAACAKGLFRIDLRTLEGHFCTEGGLPAERYYDILTDRHGRLWLTGNNGLICFDPVQHAWHRFGTEDGLLSGIFTPNAAIKIPESRECWIGGEKGINKFYPDDTRLLNSAPPVQFTRLFVNDTSFHTGYDLCLLECLDLDYTQNTLSFQFAALDFSAPGSNQYFYRLKGIEKDSISNGTQGFVRYSNLPPGDYTFEVWATNSDGVLATRSRKVQVHIRPPFWQTWWFYLLSLCTLAALIYAWFQYRLLQALKIERIRVQISSDLHDDVGTLLSGLAMQSEVLELTASENDKSKLRRIGEISRDAMARMRDTVWAIDARKDKLENLLDRMREHAEETLTPRGIRFNIQAEQLSLKQNLPTQIRQNLYLIYKEAITNAAKHSTGDMLTVTLKKTTSGSEMSICDNGLAIEKNYKTTGAGLVNMQMRAEKIGGSMEISCSKGFCVAVRW